MHGNLAGGDGGVLQNRVPVGVVLGDAVGLGQGNEALVVLLHLIQKLRLQSVALGLQGDDLCFHIGVLLLAHGQGANHVAQSGADGANQSGSTAAAGSGSIGGQHFHKGAAGFHCHIHIVQLLLKHIL